MLLYMVTLLSCHMSLLDIRVKVIYLTLPFKRQLYKMVKRTQTIRRLLPTTCLSVFDHFVGLALEGLT